MPQEKIDNSARLFRALDKIFSHNLPNHVTKLVIELEFGSLPVITATYYPEIKENLLITEQFELKSISKEKEE